LAVTFFVVSASGAFRTAESGDCITWRTRLGLAVLDDFLLALFTHGGRRGFARHEFLATVDTFLRCWGAATTFLHFSKSTICRLMRSRFLNLLLTLHNCLPCESSSNG
jgi:hypothetical protein